MDACMKRACQLMDQRAVIIDRLFASPKPPTNKESKSLDHISRQLKWLRSYQIKTR